MASFRALIGVVVIAGVGCSDGRCSVENVNKVVQSCRVEPAGADLGACLRAWGTATNPPVVDFGPMLSADCNAEGLGPLIQCVADKSSECGTTTATADVVSACETQTGDLTVSADCSAACETKRQTCVAACVAGLQQPLTTAQYTTCLSCTDTCGQTSAQCTHSCPTG
jgi:hypothetical protein